MKNKISLQSRELIADILQDRPQLHRGDTEISRAASTEESCLPSSTVAVWVSGKADCYGINSEVANFIADHVDASSKSLEIGSGLSTLVFAICQGSHVCVTPNGIEADGIRAYASRKGINVEQVKFVISASDKYLPTADIENLDFVFIDGKHAFPWPIVDWFYTADRLKRGGVMLIDDIHMISGSILVDFMRVDPRWSLLADLNGRTMAFKKEAASVHDVSWHMQPYLVNALLKQEKSERAFSKRVVRKVRRLLR